ncbi:unnamed protein product [Clavelina lepadiformis]|uniref:Uncharacterized protein n=1 Tax=Clavelina lepadiformis TaxID=159417 RepID=A0ABP0GCK3_CLALP
MNEERDRSPDMPNITSSQTGGKCSSQRSCHLHPASRFLLLFSDGIPEQRKATKSKDRHLECGAD